jgi:hypothetical protein
VTAYILQLFFIYIDNIAEPKDFSVGNKNTIARININTTIQDYMNVEEAPYSAISAACVAVKKH